MMASPLVARCWRRCALRQTGPLKLVLAAPVAPAEMIAALAGECDEIICLAQPTPFHAVGAHYANFNQVSDHEVFALLEQASRLKQA